MIQIRKPAPPDRLEAGLERTVADCAAYDEDPEAYTDGSKRFYFSDSIYGHEAVRRALRDAHHGKCCYCEGRFGAFSPANVEHYRPKGAVRQARESGRLFPGYYWLAYSWTNLYWCCSMCNSAYKRDLFPLSDPGGRARSHADNVGAEAPLIVDPGTNDPSVHLEFRGEYAFHLTEIGKRTIAVIGLNRDDLVEERAKHLVLLQTLRDLLQVYALRNIPDDEKSQGARRILADAVAPSAPFSALARAFLQGTQFVRPDTA